MSEVAAALAVAFHVPKAGSTESEWEDGAGHRSADGPGASARFVVVDGATEAYDSLRWVRQLVSSFLAVGDDEPADLAPASLDGWFGRMQQRWLDEAPRQFASVFEERKFHDDGSFATFAGCEVQGLGGPRPRWSAVAVGDAVLFHVRDGSPVAQLPQLAADDFGIDPHGLSTQAWARERMRAAVRHGSGALRVGDVLLMATDALAEWLLRTARSGNACWAAMTAIEHPEEFRRVVTRERGAGRMRNDDVTLLAVRFAAADADVLVVCR